ncbi:HAD hydrolase-like protein [candidate division KSB1 bacterium]|nr:HAD hydrolase-like protein [candidate division KSB1 bacterium]
MKVLLFDIDGTLVLSGGAGLRAMNEAFFRVFGVRDALVNINLAGRTDTSIIKDAMQVFNIQFDDKKIEFFKQEYFELVKHEILVPGNGRRIMPGVKALLEQLSNISDVHMGLLTGNWETSGRVKLDFFDLGKYFNFGAFSDDSEWRDQLLPFAVKRFERLTGLLPEKSDIYVIGDTPADIMCAKPWQAVSVAVGASHYSVEDLKKYQPDFIFQDLTDESVLEILG